MKILLCPLNWGLGHATRCVPIVEELLKQGHEVILGSDGNALRILQQRFPSLISLECPSYNLSYSKGHSQIWAIAKQLPKMIWVARKEQLWLKKKQKELKIDLVISDNRFGLWHKQIPSIYICHQIHLQLPKEIKALEVMIRKLHYAFLKKFDEVWIPDFDQDFQLAGSLSHPRPSFMKCHYIGILSRLRAYQNTAIDTQFETVILISGLEPQRSIFEKEMIEKYATKETKNILIQGKPKEKQSTSQVGNLIIYPHIDDQTLASILLASKKIICRSGYSTLMDLASLGVLHKAELHPTPGQTEQEYLAQHTIGLKDASFVVDKAPLFYLPKLPTSKK